MKATLVLKINQIIETGKFTQMVVAAAMGIDQPKVSVLLGRFRGYSVDRFKRFLVALGQDVEIVVQPSKQGSAELCVA